MEFGCGEGGEELEEAPPPFMLQAWLVWGREELLRNLREVARLESWFRYI